MRRATLKSDHQHRTSVENMSNTSRINPIHKIGKKYILETVTYSKL